MLPGACVWARSLESPGAQGLAQNSPSHSETFREFVGTFAGDRETLVGGSPPPSGTGGILKTNSAAMRHKLPTRGPEDRPLSSPAPRWDNDRTVRQGEHRGLCGL